MKPPLSATVETFASREDLVRATNLADYTQAAKAEAGAFVADWSLPYWEGVGYFVKQEHAPRGSLKRNAISTAEWLDESFIDFAKAYVVERHLVNPAQSRSGHIKRLQALRLLEATLLGLRGDASPLGIDGSILDATASLAKKHLQTGGAYKVGAELQRLASVLVRSGVLPVNCGAWVNPNKQPKNRTISVDAESDRARQQKLPDPAALYALADIFARDLDPTDPRAHKDTLSRLRALHGSVAAEVTKAQSTALDDVDAQDWLEVQQKHLAKVQELIAIMESALVPTGSVIRTAQGQTPTHIHRALRGLAGKALERDSAPRLAMEELLESVEAGLSTKRALPALTMREGANDGTQ